jgi:hypothetical protein
MRGTMFKSSVQRLISVLALVGAIIVLDAQIPASAQGQNYNLASMSPQQFVPLTVDPRINVTQGIFANTAKGAVVSVNGDGWVGPEGAGIFLGNSDKGVPKGQCRILIESAAPKMPATWIKMDCTAEGLWYSAVVRSNFPATDATGKETDFTVAEPIDGGFQLLKIQTKSMKSPLEWKVSKAFDKATKTIEISDFGNIRFFVRPQINSAVAVLLLSPSQAEILVKRLPAADQTEIAKALNH